ncbi:glycoside hydrolase family 16 protein [Mongoliibacter ruber]|uniref:Glycosyl hydrolase family 16 n=1 Tax=Mongoliibacter ruber TaxID=1750599 RepID=A0A2T0WQK5_9BACT|nr:glycoside hydrolase family 16 protein [Mongoliibacter ruber]PRY88955.1 glycosyl hydrolase family 16 [Mongoliibacter ruber]
MKNLIIPIALFFLIGCQSLTVDDNLIWAEEFDYEGLPDLENWTYDVGDHGWGNNELQYYTENKPENARVENGKLIIQAHQDSAYEKGYSSARLLTRGKHAWKYGYIEISAKLPKGVGTWPAIWMLPEENNYGGWPKSGEIDIMEHVGYDQGVVHGTVHTEAFNHRKNTQVGKQIQVPDCSEAFHVYAIDWQEDKIDFYLDGEKYHTFENTKGGWEEWPFDHEFHLILNIAVGGDWGGSKGVDTDIWPQQMEVDYIRVYKTRPE